jgi:hypothetical protein
MFAHVSEELWLCLARRLKVFHGIHCEGAQGAVSNGVGKTIAGPPGLKP